MINKNNKNILEFGHGDRQRQIDGYNFYGVDLREKYCNNDNLLQADLNIDSEKILKHFGLNSFDKILAYDVIEHIFNAVYVEGKLRFCRLELMNMAWDLLKPEGIFEILVPVFNGNQTGWCRDCTHLGVPWCKDSFTYFSDEKGETERLQNLYDIKARFYIKTMEERYNGLHLFIELQKR